MPARGPLAHIDLSVGDPKRSIPVYAALLEALGYERADVPHPDFQGASPSRAAWRRRGAQGTVFEIEVRPALGEHRTRPHDRYAPGLHHLAFHAASRAEVDRSHRAAVTAGATVLDEPADYSDQAGYSDGYYAAFVADPDGIKLEVVHLPDQNP